MDVSISITPLTCEFLEPLALNPSEPHRHNHEELWIITHGQPEHSIDFVSEKLQSPVIVYVARGKVHSFVPDEDTRGWLIRYPEDVIPQSRFGFYSAFLDKVEFPLQEGYCSTTLNALCEILLNESTGAHPDINVLRHLLGAILSKLEGEARNDYLSVKNDHAPKAAAFNSFLQILEQNFLRPEGVEFYADKLNMSARNLNHITQAAFGKSAGEIIETRKLTEARRLLLTSAKSVSEIGFELGYAEKSYFSRVFRKKTGITPTAFREQSFALIS